MLKRLMLAIAVSAFSLGVAGAGVAGASNGSDNGNVVNVTFPVNTEATNFCNYFEPVWLQGSVHLVVNETNQDTFLWNITGHLTGEGAYGNSYVSNFADHGTVQGAWVPPDIQISNRFHSVLVSQGAAPNQLLTITFSYPPFDVNFSGSCTG